MNPMIDLLEKEGRRGVPRGTVTLFCCPFHAEKSPSFAVYPDGHYHCFGCHAHGNARTYAIEIGLSPPPVLPWTPPKEPAPTVPIVELLERWQSSTTDESIYQLSDLLNVGYEALCAMGCCWATEHKAWAFPMYNGHRNLIGIRLRWINGHKLSVKGGKNGLFIPALLPERINTLYVCEGPTDAAALLTLGVEHAVGLPAALQGTDLLLDLCQKRQVTSLVCFVDRDDAGRRTASKIRQTLGVPSANVGLPAKDVRAFVDRGGNRAMLDALIGPRLFKINQRKEA